MTERTTIGALPNLQSSQPRSARRLPLKEIYLGVSCYRRARPERDYSSDHLCGRPPCCRVSPSATVQESSLLILCFARYLFVSQTMLSRDHYTLISNTPAPENRSSAFNSKLGTKWQDLPY